MNIATRPTYHHGNLGPALIRAARDLVNENGIMAVSLREAARRVGVSATATYRHFADKDHLLAAVAAEGYRDFASRLRDADRDDESLAGLSLAYIDFALANPGLFRLMFGPLRRDKESHPELSAAADAAFGVILEATRRQLGGRADEAESAAYAAWSFSHGLARLVLDEVIPRERAAKVCGAFLFASSVG